MRRAGWKKFGPKAEPHRLRHACLESDRPGKNEPNRDRLPWFIQRRGVRKEPCPPSQARPSRRKRSVEIDPKKRTQFSVKPFPKKIFESLPWSSQTNPTTRPARPKRTQGRPGGRRPARPFDSQSSRRSKTEPGPTPSGHQFPIPEPTPPSITLFPADIRILLGRRSGGEWAIAREGQVRQQFLEVRSRADRVEVLVAPESANVPEPRRDRPTEHCHRPIRLGPRLLG
jgi:hypothetical protein